MDNFRLAITDDDFPTNDIIPKDMFETKEDCRNGHLKKNIVPLYLQDDDDDILISSNSSSNYKTVTDTDLYNENELAKATELNSPVDSTMQDEDDSDDCVIIDPRQEEIITIPSSPDLPFNIQNNHNTPSTIHYGSPYQSVTNNVLFQNNNKDIIPFNSPINTNFVPQQYSTVNMQAFYSNYSDKQSPCFDQLMQPFHESDNYCAVDQNIIAAQPHTFIDMSGDHRNYVYNDYNTVIMQPSNDHQMVIRSNETDLFNLPGKPFSNREVAVQFHDGSKSFTNNTIINPTNHISNQNNSSSYEYEKRIKFQQEMKRKRKQELRELRVKGNEEENPETGTVNNEILIGLNWRHGPASYWYDLYNVPRDQSILSYRIKPTMVSEDETILPNIKAESFKDEDCVLSTWQLVNWEDDIFIDIQTAENQIMESNKKYACHAGWIPSSKHRSMATFQDAMCSEYFGILPASSTGTLIQCPDVSKWHSIFTLENAQITENDWVSKIIIDPRTETVHEPYLLELDLNNESIHFDFTNPAQTKEILTSELNTVYLTNTSTNQTLLEDNLTTDSIEGALATPLVDCIANKETQIKKMKILNKITEVTSFDDRLKEQPLEPMDTKSLCLVRYCDRDPYAVARDYSNRTSLCLDIIDNDDINCNSDFIDPLDPLLKHGIQHSYSATQLDPTFFPLTLDNHFLRHMHRSQFSDVKRHIVPLFHTPQPIFSLIDVVKNESEQRQKICQLTGSGDLFFMRSIADLTASTDHLVLAEYAEEYPPLMMQTGMASRIINYFKGNVNQPVIIPQLPYGELCVTPKIPFLGQLSSNQIFQTIENNMFRAPIYSHRLKPTDFMIIIRPNNICIRRVDDIFVVGQELPLMEVPAPNSKKANSFLKDFLQVQIIRMFLQSQQDPKRIRHDDIKVLFAEQSDSVLRKRLKIFAEYRKAEMGSNGSFWVLKPEFQLPSDDELLELITPEECCAYYSMMWGLCRLEDAGYNSKSFMQADPDEDDDEDGKESHLKLEDEVKAASWHTSKTFLDAQKNKCYLELIGVTDPTGCGEAFSYSRVSAMSSLFRETIKARPHSLFDNHGADGGGSKKKKKSLKGTDADLRKLTTKKACLLLKEFGISHRDFKKLKRWDIIDLVRQMSTQRAKRGDDKAVTKFARLSKLTAAGQEERYRKECQRIFNLQNQVLANDDDLTTDEGESNSENEDNDEMDTSKSAYKGLGKRLGVQCDDLDSDLFKLKRPRPDERLPTVSEGTGPYICPATADNARAILKNKPPVPKSVPKALCIRRNVQNKDGTKATLCQTIPWSTIVKIYFKMHQEHKTDYLKSFCGLNKAEEEKKARKLQQEKIRALKRKNNQRIHYLGQSSIIDSISKIAKMKKYHKKSTSQSMTNISCGACGGKGHMRTNKVCPMYMNSVKKAINKRPIHWPMRNPIIPYPATAPSTLPVLAPLPIPTPAPRAPAAVPVIAPVAAPSIKSVTRKPLSSRSRLLDSIIDQVIAGDSKNNQSDITDHQQIPVSVIENIIEHIPPDSIQEDVPPTQYITQCSAPCSLSIPVSNSEIQINIDRDPVVEAINIQPILTVPKKTTRSSSVMDGPPLSSNKHAEIVINSKIRGNRRRIDPRVALNHQFEEIYKGLLDISGFRCFLHPVSKRDFPTYHCIIEKPMDLTKIKMKINKNDYDTREGFLEDIKLIYDNCIKFNGDKNEFTTVARHMMSHVMEQFCVKERKLMRMEKLANPLMNDDDMVGLKYLLDKAVSAMGEVEYSQAFHAPVNKKRYPDYYNIVIHPMDLQTISNNISTGKYRSREEFLVDAELILTNCICYNGQESPLTDVCRKVIDAAKKWFLQRDSSFVTLETNLRLQVDDASGSQKGPSSCITADHLSHMGEDHTEDGMGMEVEVPCKRRRLSDSYEEDKTGPVLSSTVDPNRARMLADLQLTDSEDEAHDNLDQDAATEISIICSKEDVPNVSECALPKEPSSNVELIDLDNRCIESNKEPSSMNVDVKRMKLISELLLTDSDEDIDEARDNRPQDDVIDITHDEPACDTPSINERNAFNVMESSYDNRCIESNKEPSSMNVDVKRMKLISELQLTDSDEDIDEARDNRPQDDVIDITHDEPACDTPSINERNAFNVMESSYDNRCIESNKEPSSINADVKKLKLISELQLTDSDEDIDDARDNRPQDDVIDITHDEQECDTPLFNGLSASNVMESSYDNSFNEMNEEKTVVPVSELSSHDAKRLKVLAQLELSDSDDEMEMDIGRNCIFNGTQNCSKENVANLIELNDDAASFVYKSNNNICSQRLMESSYEIDKVMPLMTLAPIDPSRHRVLAQLELSDSEDEVDDRFSPGQEGIVETTFTGSEDSVSRTIDGVVPEQLSENSSSLEHKSNHTYYRKFDDNCALQENSANVIFYISDDD